jgi:phage terminase small subunit
MSDRVKAFCEQWRAKVKRGESSDLSDAEITLLLLFEEWCDQYQMYEAENEQYRQGKLAGLPIRKMPKL